MGTLKISNGSISADSFIGNLRGTAQYATYDSIHGGEIFSSRFAGDNIDLNDITDDGSYRMGSNIINAPPGGAYGQLLVLRGSSLSDTLAQVFFPYSSQNMFFRCGTTTSFSSQSWSTVLTNKNYTSFCAAASHDHNYLPLTGGAASGSLWSTTSSGSEIQIGVSNTAGKIYFYSQSVYYGIYTSTAGSIVRISSGGKVFCGGKYLTTNYGSTLPSSGEVGEIFYKT